jgi:hypothetical protein
MNDRGVFAVSRGVFDHPSFAPEPYTEREAWLWMIGAAAWKPMKVRVGRTIFDLARGQLVFAGRFLATRWRWSEARVRRFLNRLKIDAMVMVLTTREATQITICNYDKYAFDGRTRDAPNDAQGDAEPTHSRRKEEEFKEVKKEEIETVEARKRATRLTEDWMPSEDDGRYAVDKGLTRAEAQHEFEKFRNYWQAKSGQQATKLDWSKTWRNWILTTVERKGKPHANGSGRGRQSLSELAFDLADEARKLEHQAGVVGPDDPVRGH